MLKVELFRGMVKRMSLNFLIFCLWFSGSTFAQEQIFHFDFKDFFPIERFELLNSEDNDTLLVVAALDSSGKNDEKIQGEYKFVINGFITDLHFIGGKAQLNYSVQGNTIIFIKHENKSETLSKLYYVYSSSSARVPVSIPMWIIAVIPLFILLVTIVLRRWILISLLVLFVLFFLFSGLDAGALWKLFVDSAGGLFN